MLSLFGLRISRINVRRRILDNDFYSTVTNVVIIFAFLTFFNILKFYLNVFYICEIEHEAQ